MTTLEKIKKKTPWDKNPTSNTPTPHKDLKSNSVKKSELPYLLDYTSSSQHLLLLRPPIHSPIPTAPFTSTDPNIFSPDHQSIHPYQSQSQHLSLPPANISPSERLALGLNTHRSSADKNSPGDSPRSSKGRNASLSRISEITLRSDFGPGPVIGPSGSIAGSRADGVQSATLNAAVHHGSSASQSGTVGSVQHTGGGGSSGRASTHSSGPGGGMCFCFFFLILLLGGRGGVCYI